VTHLGTSQEKCHQSLPPAAAALCDAGLIAGFRTLETPDRRRAHGILMAAASGPAARAAGPDRPDRRRAHGILMAAVSGPAARAARPDQTACRGPVLGRTGVVSGTFSKISDCLAGIARLRGSSGTSSAFGKISAALTGLKWSWRVW
jgi:hypothetical protein